MRTATCPTVRRLLSAYCDGELPMGRQVLVEFHLRRCVSCRAEVDVVRDLGASLRSDAPLAWDPDLRGADVSSLQTDVLWRICAEQTLSWRSRVRAVFDDMWLVWAVTASVVITLGITGLLMAGLWRSTEVQPGSIAALIEQLGAPRARTSGPLVLPRPDPDALMPATVIAQVHGQDRGELTVTAIVGEDGRLSGVELVSFSDPADASHDAKALANLLAAVSTAEFEPARRAGAPVPLSVVWMLAHTTVRPSAEPPVRMIGERAASDAPAFASQGLTDILLTT